MLTSLHRTVADALHGVVAKPERVAFVDCGHDRSPQKDELELRIAQAKAEV
jgi:hypothetical protein